MKEDQVVTFRIARGDVEALDALAWDAHVSRGEMIRRLIREAIKERKETP